MKKEDQKVTMVTSQQRARLRRPLPQLLPLAVMSLRPKETRLLRLNLSPRRRSSSRLPE